MPPQSAPRTDRSMGARSRTCFRIHRRPAEPAEPVAEANPNATVAVAAPSDQCPIEYCSVGRIALGSNRSVGRIATSGGSQRRADRSIAASES